VNCSRHWPSMFSLVLYCRYQLPLFQCIDGDVWCVYYRKQDEVTKLNIRMKCEALMLTCGRWHRFIVLPCQNMGQCCNPRPVIIALLATEIIFLVFTIFVSVDYRRRQSLFQTTPTPTDVATVDYDNDTADEFLANYSIYCEKFLIPKVLNIQHYSRRTRLCPCIPNDLGLFRK